MKRNRIPAGRVTNAAAANVHMLASLRRKIIASKSEVLNTDMKNNNTIMANIPFNSKSGLANIAETLNVIRYNNDSSLSRKC